MFRRVYYEKVTGNIIVNYSFNGGSFTTPTVEQDFTIHKDLVERVKDAVGVKEFTNGEYEQDFRECTGVRVNPETLALEFTYPNPGAPTETVYQKPLTEQIAELKDTIDIMLTEIIPSITGGV